MAGPKPKVLSGAERLRAFSQQQSANPTDPFRRKRKGWSYSWFVPRELQDPDRYRHMLFNLGFEPVSGPGIDDVVKAFECGGSKHETYVVGVPDAEVWGRDPETVEAAKQQRVDEVYANPIWLRLQMNRVKRGSPFLPDRPSSSTA